MYMCTCNSLPSPFLSSSLSLALPHPSPFPIPHIFVTEIDEDESDMDMDDLLSEVYQKMTLRWNDKSTSYVHVRVSLQNSVPHYVHIRNIQAEKCPEG